MADKRVWEVTTALEEYPHDQTKAHVIAGTGNEASVIARKLALADHNEGLEDTRKDPPAGSTAEDFPNITDADIFVQTVEWQFDLDN